MTILLTNDDGYNYEGIRVLKRCLEKYARVIIVAPEEVMSAKSTSITIGEPLELIEREKDIYSVSGTPADCVALAMAEIDEDFDLVVSGCNDGLNISYDTIYSGTVGACLEALTYEKKAIAVSCPNFCYDIVERNFDMVWEFINKYDLLSNEYLLNVNFPTTEPKAIQLGREYYRRDFNYFELQKDGYYAFRKLDAMKHIDEDTDCYQVVNGIISVVPLQRTLYSENLYKKLLKKVK